MLSEIDAVDKARELRDEQDRERKDLDLVRRYWQGRQRLPGVIPRAAPREVLEMARMARVNVIEIVVESLAQSLHVDGFRTEHDGPDGPEDVDAAHWHVWQANRLDKRQSGLHRAACAYGTAYNVVWMGTPAPVVRPVSPRLMTAQYGADPDWPMYALERQPRRGGWMLYDAEAGYFFAEQDDALRLVSVTPHPFGVPPVVRFTEVEDLDDDDDAQPDDGDPMKLTRGQVAPLRKLQDQIDLITFNLLVAQHYSAFRQRLIIGWVADEEAKVASAASQLWTIDGHPDDIRAQEFEETSLDGYIQSREASMSQAATLSQTPVHELVGKLVNLSAEALAAAEAGRERKIDDRQTNLGESHEQTFELVGVLTGDPVPNDAQVVWRDTSARSFSATVDGLGKLAQMLGVPPSELWERIPGVTQQDARRWRAVAAEGDALGELTRLLDRQATPPEPEEASGLILPPGVAA